MANQRIGDDTVLYKTSIEKLPDGKCVKRVMKSKNGKTETKEEHIDCEKAMMEVHEKENKNEDNFNKGNVSFDERMREKLKDINKGFSGDSKENVKTKEETYFDGTSKVVKVTRESNSLEETKKTEKIPDGIKRTLTVTRESFLEETEKSVKPEEVLTEEKLEGTSILDESFAEEAKEHEVQEKKDIEVEDKVHKESLKYVNSAKESDQDKIEKRPEIYESETEIKKTEGEEEEEEEESYPEERMQIIEPEDGILKKIVKSIFKILFYPLYKLNIL